MPNAGWSRWSYVSSRGDASGGEITNLGRRRVDPAVEARHELKAGGDDILKIGRKLGIGTSVVQRVSRSRCYRDAGGRSGQPSSVS
jgi:hypothetical protein